MKLENRHYIIMVDTFLKKEKYYRKRNLLASFVYFLLFTALSVLFLLVYGFYSHIYLYSDGFDEDCLYTTNPIGNILQGRIPESDYSAFENNYTITDHDHIWFVSYTDISSIQNPYGFFYSDRVFFRFTSKTEINIDKNFCFTSEKDIKTIRDNDIDYPVAGRLEMHYPQNIETHLKSMGYRHIDLRLIVSEKPMATDLSSYIIHGHEYLMDEIPSLIKGSELNQFNKEGYSTLLPLIYVGFLVPFSACAISFGIIISRLEEEDRKEIALWRYFGKKKRKAVLDIFLPRLLHAAVGYFACLVIFLPVHLFLFSYPFSYAALVLSIQFAYALLLVFFQTWREAGKVYSHPNLLGGDSL